MQKCDICGNITDRKVRFNFMEVWKEAHEWTDLPQIGVPCRDCIGVIRDQEEFRRRRMQCEPMPMAVGPQKFWGDLTIASIGIFDGELIGIRCAKLKYGCDAVTEMIQGFCYENENGELIKRATVEDVPETERCHKCRLTLWACNALEVTV